MHAAKCTYARAQGRPGEGRQIEALAECATADVYTRHELGGENVLEKKKNTCEQKEGHGPLVGKDGGGDARGGGAMVEEGHCACLANSRTMAGIGMGGFTAVRSISSPCRARLDVTFIESQRSSADV